MALFATSLIAGFLTILAPCVLPLLPVILGGSLTEARDRRRPLVIVASLAVSVFVFTLLLKGSTALISVSPSFWSYVSAAILAIFGLSLVFPYAWARFVLRIPGHNKPEAALSSRSAIVVGLALGPVFTTCSPTFFLILATVLPLSVTEGLTYLIAYIVGLSGSLLLVSYIGQRLVNRLEWATNPDGWFRKGLGILFIVVAVFVATGLDKKIETAILDAGLFDVTKLEQSIRESFEGRSGDKAPATATGDVSEPPKNSLTSNKIKGEIDGGKYIELVNIAGYINTEPIKLADLVGKKVIIIDFIDYSCINCQRTFPYMVDWYKKYKDQGLEIVAIHTPEFSFEKDIRNVTAAAKQFGLQFPIVLDNDYSTWNAYKNQYWPHKYIVDINGRVVYEHIGEGAYTDTEAEIVKQLNIRRQKLGEAGTVGMGTSTVPDYAIRAASPETYFGAWRNENFGNGQPGFVGDQTFEIPAVLETNQYYLGGAWRIDREYAESTKSDAKISYVFLASKVYLVGTTKDGVAVPADIYIDGKFLKTVTIQESKLYQLYEDPMPAKHRIDIIFKKPGARAYTFTFG